MRLRDERQRRGWSLTKVSGITGIAASDLSQMERGLRPIFPGWRRRLARAFGVPMAQLFEERVEPPAREEAAQVERSRR